MTQFRARLIKAAVGRFCGRFPLVTILAILSLVQGPQSSLYIVADEQITPPGTSQASGFDMSVLANLASNIGSNPQLMNLVSNFLNPNGNQTQAVAAAGPVPQADAILAHEQDSNLIQQGLPSNEPLRRSSRPTAPDQQQQQQPLQQPQQLQVQANPGPAPTQSGGLGGLMSMLPGVLSSISSSGGGPGGPLAGLLGSLAKPAPTQQSATTVSTSSGTTDQQQTIQFQQQQQQQANVASQASQAAAVAPLMPPPPPTSPGVGPAQSVINQVLAAYLSRQIPDELIQLGLSGRIPPQLIELALSGQVPPQLIQMVITGQVPMSTINAFLNAMQPNSGTAVSPRASAANSGPQASSSSSTSTYSTPGRVFSTTRALFEAIFKRDNNGKPVISVPTLLGNIPIKIPTMPNMRSFGQMVGGTITNVASMIPF